MTSYRGPDCKGRYWDEDYTDVDFLACVMECNTQRQWQKDHPQGDYWPVVDVWFKHNFPERWDKQFNVRGDPATGQMGFKIAIYHWLGTLNGTRVVKS